MDMKTWLYFLTAGSAVCLVVYLLYCRGIAVTKRITAVLFVFRTGKMGTEPLNSCTGWVRRVERFRTSGIYTFTLDCQLSKGDAAVSLLDKDKRELLRLDRISAGGTVALCRENRYYLCWRFHGATGTCGLHWKSGSAI